MKQPRQIEYPNTRSRRASYGKPGPQSDLNAMAGQHWQNVQNRLKQANENELSGTGWQASVGSSEPFRVIYNHEGTGYSYDPSSRKLYKNGLYGGNPQQPELPPEIDFSDLEQENRLGELAYASDEFGRDLYHDAAYRSGQKKIPYEELEKRPGYDLQGFSEDELYDYADELKAGLELDPNMSWRESELNNVLEEIKRRKAERE